MSDDNVSSPSSNTVSNSISKKIPTSSAGAKLDHNGKGGNFDVDGNDNNDHASNDDVNGNKTKAVVTSIPNIPSKEDQFSFDVNLAELTEHDLDVLSRSAKVPTENKATSTTTTTTTATTTTTTTTTTAGLMNLSVVLENLGETTDFFCFKTMWAVFFSFIVRRKTVQALKKFKSC